MKEKPNSEITQSETISEEKIPIALQKTQEKKWIKPLIFTLLGMLVAAGLFFGGYKFAQLRQQIEAPKTAEIPETELPPQSDTFQQALQNKIYFGKGGQGVYSLVDVSTGETKEFIPAGYEIVDQHSYQTYPEFLILKKENQLFSYSLLNKTLSELKLETLKDSEKVRLYSSISDKSKFYLVINDTKEIVGDMGGYEIIGSRKYFFDGNSNQIQNADDVNLPGISNFLTCYEYDSKYSRFFIWPCGEGIGSSVPLLVYDFLTKTQKELVAPQDFGLAKDYIGLVSAEYNNGYFLMIPKSKDKFSKIIIINPTKEIVKEVYTVSDKVKSELDETYSYSALLVKEKNTIVIGGNHFILLLRFDKSKEIINSKYLQDLEIYANFIFTDGENVYYQAGVQDKIRVVNLDAQQVERSISSEYSETVTLFFFAE